MSDTFDFSRRAMLGSALGLGTVGAVEGSALAATPPIPTSPTTTYRLTAKGIPGDAGNGAMEVLTFGFGSTTSASPFLAPVNNAAKSVPVDFVFVKPMDSASPLLHKNLVLGKTISPFVLTGTASGAQYDFLRLELALAMVTSYAVAPSETDGSPLDVVRVKFIRIKQVFTPPSTDGPGAGTPVTFFFDFEQNRT